MDEDDFLQVIAQEVEADPQNLALREDFITLLLQRDPDRAARELAVFEASGGDPARSRLMRARIMAARLRSGGAMGPADAAIPGAPAAAVAELSAVPHEPPAPAAAPAAASRAVPAPTNEDSAIGGPRASAGLWDAERPSVTLADVAGLAEVKQHLDATFLAPLRNPELAAAFGQRPGGSLLMCGPPGCGKTFIAKAIAGDLGASFIHVTLADLLSKWIGDSEKAIQSVFEDARAAAPCVIFFDEFDALGGRRASGGGGAHSMRMIVT